MSTLEIILWIVAGLLWSVLCVLIGMQIAVRRGWGKTESEPEPEPEVFVIEDPDKEWMRDVAQTEHRLCERVQFGSYCRVDRCERCDGNGFRRTDGESCEPCCGSGVKLSHPSSLIPHPSPP